CRDWDDVRVVRGHVPDRMRAPVRPVDEADGRGPDPLRLRLRPLRLAAVADRCALAVRDPGRDPQALEVPGADAGREAEDPGTECGQAVRAVAGSGAFAERALQAGTAGLPAQAGRRRRDPAHHGVRAELDPVLCPRRNQYLPDGEVLA